MRESVDSYLATAISSDDDEPSAQPEGEAELPEDQASGKKADPVETEVSPAQPPWWQRWRPSLAVSAFAMSLVITLISAFDALRGSEIVVLAPDQVLIYRDGEGEASVMSMAMRLEMINSASTHGDVLVEATLQPRQGGPKFRYQSLVRPVFADMREAPTDCALGSRCLTLPGLYLIETFDEIVAMAGGSARATFLSFPVTEWNCEGTPEQCRSYATFDEAATVMGAEPIDVAVTLFFHSDGRRTVRCRTVGADVAYMRRAGWLAVPCSETQISDPPLL